MSEHELDLLIDAALPGYLPEPPAGLPERVLERVRRPRVWPWAAGMAAAAGLVVASLVPEPPRVDAPPLVAVHAAHAPAVGLTPPRATPAVHPVRLTRTERALIQFAQSNPELMQQVFVEAPRQMALDLTIQPIVIEPLSTGGE